MRTKDLIKKLQEIDPEGNRFIVSEMNDGYCYDVFSVKLGLVKEGVIEDDENNPVQGENCVILDATN